MAANHGEQIEALNSRLRNLTDAVERLKQARGRRCGVCMGTSPPWDGHDKNPPCEEGAWEMLDAALKGKV